MLDDFSIGKGDLLPSLLIQATTKINGQLVPFPGLATPGTTVVFNMKSTAGVLKINSSPAVIVDAAEAILRYDFSGTDTDTAGDYWGEFKANIGGSKLITIPNIKRKIPISVTEDVDN